MVVGLCQIAGAGQDVQGSVHLNGEMLEVLAKLRDVKGIRTAQSVADCHLRVIVYIFIDLANIVFLRKRIGDAFL